MQMAAQAEQSRAIGEEMAKAFDGPPNASDAESASRTTMPNDDLNRARRFIQASLRGGDYQSALDATMRLAELMKPSYGTVAPGHSTTIDGQIQEQAPGTWGVDEGMPVHSTGGVGADMTPVARAKLDIERGKLDIKRGEAATDVRVADAQIGRYGAQAGADAARGTYYNAQAEKAKLGGTMSMEEVAQAIVDTNETLLEMENAGIPVDDSMRQKLQAHLEWLYNYGAALDEASGFNTQSLNDPDSTQEGYGDDRITVPKLEQYGGPVSPTGGLRYDPATKQLVPLG
jgi:hypothetical protein